MSGSQFDINDVKELASVLIPLFREAMRDDLHEMRDEILDTIKSEREQSNAEMDALRSRIVTLEGRDRKVLMILSAVAFLGGTVGTKLLAVGLKFLGV